MGYRVFAVPVVSLAKGCGSLAVRNFRLDCFDGSLSQRMSPQEWRRTLILRNHPRFFDGLFKYDELIPDYFAHNLVLNRVVTEAWRFEMLVYALHLHDTRDPADPRTGLTAGRLQALCAANVCASPGRVLAILGIMQLAGYLKRVRSTIDSRIVHLVPSNHFVAIVEGWNGAILHIIDAISPADALARDYAARPRFGQDMRQLGAETVIGGWKLLDPFPEVAHFISRDGGWMLLLRCVALALAPSAGAEIAPVSLALDTFGKTFGVSRSHLRRVLESAYAAGLLEAPPRNGADIRLAPHLVASFLACMASELGNYRLWALEVQRRPGYDRTKFPATSEPCATP